MSGFARFGLLVLGGVLSISSMGSGIARAETKATPQAPKIDSLDTLFAEFIRSPGLYARFHEEKQIALLVSPITNDGTIHFDKTHGLARHTTAPRRESVLLSRGALTLWDGQKTETIALRRSATLRALAEAFSLMLAADRAGLERNFTLSLQPRALGEWTLTLAPLAPDLRRMVVGIEVAGQGATPKMLRVREASGDVSTTTFTDVDPNRRYSQEQAAAIFKVPTGARP
ncbi:MAG: outer membrane lipoprotein carrier protein LolA [Myxococcales bacterium]|nr:outer membrane lipoprotein carrier protein LolA [Myxococcales bacterium]